MLETGAVLRTWALSELPTDRRSVVAEALPDHRLDYLDYEGPVSGNRGHVTRHDAGDFTWVEQQEHRLVVDARGRHASMRLELVCDPTTQRWLLNASSIERTNRGV